jgi:hypothetical protein
MTDSALRARESKRPASNVDVALDLAGRGFHVFPITPGAKFPPLVRWKTEATTDRNKIRRLWVGWPTANIGIATGPSGLFVVDIDIRDGRPGEYSLEGLELMWGDLPATLTARSASGGRHLYLRGSVKSRNGYLGDGLDAKSLGGYVVAPGSTLADGGGYSWENPEVPIAEAPAWLVTLAEPQRVEYADDAEAGDMEPETLARILAQIPVGDFRDHDAWFGLMCACHHATAGLGREEFADWSTNDPPYAGREGQISYRWDSLHLDLPGNQQPITKAHLFGTLYRYGGHETYCAPEEDFDPLTEAELTALFNGAMTTADGGEFRWLTLDELEALGPPEWMIMGILPRWSYGMLYGPSGSGKSFLALEMAICVATGADFHGRATRATGGAFYVAAEDPRDFPIRERAWRKHHGVAGRPAVRFLEGSLTLNLPGKAEKLAASILGVDPEPGIIVIDTLSATFAGNENTDDVKTFLAACRTLRDTTKATVIFVHHTGKDEGREHLGSQHLRNDGDFVLRMDGEPQKAEAYLSAKKFKGAATPGVLMNLVKTVVKIDESADSLVLVEEIEGDFIGEPDEAIGIVAGFPDGSKMAEIAAAVAEELGLRETAARNRVHKAFGIEKGRPGHAIAWGNRSLRLERSDPRNGNSGLILRVE